MQVQTNHQTNQVSSPGSNAAPTVSNSVTSILPDNKTGLTPPANLNKKPLITESNNSTAQVRADAQSPTDFSEKDSQVKLKKTKSLIGKKQIPTFLGLLILFVALIAGVLLFGQGTGVFAPRATPQTTPKNIRISNVTDKTFTISFYTDESTVAFVKYGADEKKLDKQASDDRDQLSGVVKDYRLHHITVRSLEPGKNYFYVLGTGSSTFDNEGLPYNVATAAKQNQSPPNNQTVYGNVIEADGSPVEGAIVYVYSDSMGTLSNLVKSSGSWGIALANAFSLDKSTYATLSDESPIEIKIQGIEPDLFNSVKTTISSAQPIADLILGQADTGISLNNDSDQKTLDLNKEELLADVETTTDSATNVLTEASSSSSNLDIQESSSSGGLENLLAPEIMSETSLLEPEALNLSELNDVDPASATVIMTTQPQIKATLPANTIVRITIHSDTQIDETMQTDADGNVFLDVASLGQNLEPGEHTASYTYIDPITGAEVTKTVNFTVDPTATPRQLAAASTPTPTPTPKTSVPYGSGNPYVPTITATPTAVVAPLISTSSTTVSTSSGQYSAGSVGTTIALLLGGVFFILAGVWSYFLANSFEIKK